VRNFTDVRDVCAAYRIAVEQPPGIWNVCSGRTVSLRDVMGILLAASEVADAVLKQAPGLGASDRGSFPAVSARKLRAAGWEPRIPLETTLSELLDYWRSR
jgi:GDP-4-dehydro-6-deoxy-D-mannose reductase